LDSCKMGICLWNKLQKHSTFDWLEWMNSNDIIKIDRCPTKIF
jgi:hypothetical protein